MDLITLEAREVLLEHEREQCFEEERARKESLVADWTATAHVTAPRSQSVSAKHKTVGC